MRVRCVKLVNPRGEVQVSSSWLTLGKEYEVITVLFLVGKPPEYQLVSDTADFFEGIGYFPSASFDLVDGSLPLSWTIGIKQGGTVEIGPEELREPGFWERFYDGDPAAASVVTSVLSRLADETTAK